MKRNVGREKWYKEIIKCKNSMCVHFWFRAIELGPDTPEFEPTASVVADSSRIAISQAWSVLRFGSVRNTHDQWHQALQ
jgi:hypothetical protein